MLSYGKSPGMDNLPADLIKNAGDFGKKIYFIIDTEDLVHLFLAQRVETARICATT